MKPIIATLATLALVSCFPTEPEQEIPVVIPDPAPEEIEMLELKEAPHARGKDGANH